MKRWLLARHGETTGNADNLVQGHTDVPLTDRGKLQATLLARRLAGEPLDAIYASDLRRAWDTAALIAERHRLEVRAEPRLREAGKGVWEGRPWSEIEARYAAALAAWQHDRDQAPPGGETMAQVVARLSALLEHLRSDPAECVLLVAHGAVLRMLICLALGIDPGLAWNFDLDNAALAELHLHPAGIVLHRLNETGYLQPLQREPRE